MKRILVICTIFAGASCYAQTDNPACLDVPLNVTSNTKEVTVGATLPNMTTEQTYVYYHRRKHSKRSLAPEFADVPDNRASNPILLSRDKDIQAAQPQSYSVTLATPEDRMKVCPDSTLNVQANISVEQENEYTGNYPTANDKKNYKLVSKRTYHRTARKMRNAERKEERVARLTGVTVHTSTSM